MKKLVALLAIVITMGLTMMGETYEITALSTPTVTIGGKTLKKGDRFNGNANIKWVDNKQSMEVKALSSGELYRFSRKAFESKGSVLSIADFFLKTKEGSSRGEGSNVMFTKSNKSGKYPEKRIALVMGNSNYESLSYLKNAQKDASDLAETLLQLGFDVMESYECNYTDMKTALNNFSAKSRGYDVALFYFAGHGIQEDGQNYLIPIERGLEFRSELNSCLNCEDIMQRMDAGHAPAKIMFLDACRHTKRSWTRDVSEGLARMEGSIGSVIVFSTQSGNAAYDGEGSNSPFAESLMKNIKRENVAFTEAMTGVVRDTYAKTNNKQFPLQVGTLIVDFRFNPSSNTASVTPTPSTSTGTSVPEITTISSKPAAAGAEALYEEGVKYEGEKNYAKALEYYKKSAEEGHSKAQAQVGYYYSKGLGMKSADKDEAVRWYRKAADQGNKIAQYNLGLCYEYGTGVSKDFKEAFKLFKKSADQGCADAMTEIGYFIGKGLVGQADDVEALKWYRKGAEQGNEVAMFNMGVYYESGRGTEKDYKEALKWYEKSAEQGNVSGQYRTGYFYENGIGAPKNSNLAAKWYGKAAAQGDKVAQYKYGLCYEEGRGVVQDNAEALKWFRKSADQGNADAQLKVGYYYGVGKVVEKDQAEALKWYLKSANQGNQVAQYNVGIYYENGYGVEKDYAAALSWYKKSAQQGYEDAQFLVGYFYDKGLGVAENKSEATKWYAKAADKGHAASQNNLGVLYENGQGVKQSYEDAALLYGLSAEQGNKYGCYNLAMMYREGKGVEKNLAEAKKWMKKAADLGHKSAQKELAAMEQTTSATSTTTSTNKAKTIELEGTVVDSKDGEPLIGCTIYVHSTNQGYISDIDGKFILKKVAVGSKITVSYVGYESATFTVDPAWEGTRITVRLVAE